jgi:uncharacterized protein YneF (UPF0154 family)
MKTEIKIAGLMILMMLAGIAIGALFHRAVMREYIRDIVRTRDAGLFRPGPERMLKSLSPEQEKTIREVFNKHGRQLAEIHSRFRQEIESSFESLKKEIDPILTSEQLKEFKKALPAPPPFPWRRPGEFPLGGWIPNQRMELEDLRSALGLTDDQAVLVATILDEFREKARAQHLENAEKVGPESFREAVAKRDLEIEKVLSDEQRKAFRKYRETPRGREAPPDPRSDARMPWPFDR